LKKHGDANGELSISINPYQKDLSFYLASSEVRNSSNFVKSVTIKLGKQDSMNTTIQVKNYPKGLYLIRINSVKGTSAMFIFGPGALLLASVFRIF
jgi:hypothetical protein